MIAKTDAINALLKALEGTLSLAGVSKVEEESNDEQVLFAGEAGDLRLVFENNFISLFGKKDEDERLLAQTLFEPEVEDWVEKDTLSTAADVAESVAAFFGISSVLPGQKAPAAKKASGKKADQPQQPKKAGKKNKKDAQAYDVINLAYRMEAIFPELAGSVDSLVEKYGKFLPEEYFSTYANSYIVDAVKKNDRNILKRLFKSLNAFYEEGEKDTQSLVAVSILGMNMAKDADFAKNLEGWLGEDLGPAVEQIATFLQKSGKKYISKFENPVPYKESAKAKLKGKMKKSFKENVFDPEKVMLDPQVLEAMNNQKK